MPEFPGPFLAAPDKPEVDPAIKAVVEIGKGNIGPLIPARENTGGSVANGAGAGGGGSPCTPASFPLKLPHPAEQAGGGCLLPTGPEVRLTYGVYEGGGKVKTAQDAGSNDTANGSAGSRIVKPPTSNEMVAPKEADASKRCGGSATGESGGVGTGGGGVTEFAESTMPMVHTPRVMPTPSRTSVKGEQLARTYSPFIARTPRELSGSIDGRMPLEEMARRKREATARLDAELEVALWMEGVTGVTFPGKFWSSLKDGGEVILSLIPCLISRVILRVWLSSTSDETVQHARASSTATYCLMEPAIYEYDEDEVAYAESVIFRVPNRSKYLLMMYCRIQRTPACSGFVFVFPSVFIPQAL